MLAMIFSRVLLPEPLRPTIPKNSPWWTSKLDAAQRPQLRPPRLTGMREPLLERVDPLVRDVKLLVDIADLDHHRPVEQLGTWALERRCCLGIANCHGRPSVEPAAPSGPGRSAAAPAPQPRLLEPRGVREAGVGGPAGHVPDQPAPGDPTCQRPLAAERLPVTRERA